MKRILKNLRNADASPGEWEVYKARRSDTSFNILGTLTVYLCKILNAAIALSTSSGVLEKPKENRTVPLGKVSRVLWAEGAQCRPQRVKIP